MRVNAQGLGTPGRWTSDDIDIVSEFTVLLTLIGSNLFARNGSEWIVNSSRSNRRQVK